MVANVCYESWNNVSVTVTGYTLCTSSGNDHTETDTDYATPYRITVETREKPWGGAWGTVEDSGTYSSSSRSWYHMWQINENAIRATVAPSVLKEWVTDTSFSGMDTGDFSPASDAPATATPAWKKITSGTGTYLPVTAVAHVGDAELQGTQATVDIAINDINEVKWLHTDYSRTVVEDSKTMNLAELKNPQTVTPKQYYFDEVWSVYPTFNVDGSGLNLNETRVSVTLSQAVPDGMEATVHLAWFDPKDGFQSISYFEPLNKPWTSNNSGDGNQKKDNRISLTITDSSLEFLGGSTTQIVLCSFASECFGDNVIVAVHPNAGAATKYKFSNESPANPLTYWQNLQYQASPTSDFALLPYAMRTPVLFVASWCGFKVHNQWIVNFNDYTIATVDDSASGEKYCKSVLSSSAYEMSIKYKFGQNRPVDGYVLPVSQEKKEKLSFVSNSGIKLGKIDAGTGTTHEVALIDLHTMVEMAGGIDKFEFDGTHGIDNTGNVKIKIPTDLTRNYVPEPLNRLMNAVRYGQAYADMQPYDTAADVVNGATLTGAWQKYYNTLVNNKTNLKATGQWNTIKIVLDSSMNLSVISNEVPDYDVETRTENGDGHIYLQSHHGSEVHFADGNIKID